MTAYVTWVRTEPTLDGSTYHLTLGVNDDLVVALNPVTAHRYARRVLEAVARAEYDAAVFRLCTNGFGAELEAAATLVSGLRADLPEMAPIPGVPLDYRPAVSATDHRPFVYVLTDGQATGQLEVAEARAHALHVLEGVTAADLDAAFYRRLIGWVGVDEGRARAAVHDIGRHRKQDE